MARGRGSTDRAQRGPYKNYPGPILHKHVTQRLPRQKPCMECGLIFIYSQTQVYSCRKSISSKTENPVLPIEKFPTLVLPRNAIMLLRLIIQFPALSSVVAYERLKTKENFKLLALIKGRSRLQEVPNTVILLGNFSYFGKRSHTKSRTNNHSNSCLNLHKYDDVYYKVIIQAQFNVYGIGRTWQIFGKICLPCGRNLSSGDIAKCDPKFSGWRKTLQNRKTSKMPKCLGGAGRFWKTRAKQ